MSQYHDSLRQKHIDFPIPEQAIVGEHTRESIVSTELFLSLTKRQGILLCGTSQTVAPFSFARHCPDIWQVLVTINGTGEVWNPKSEQWEALAEGWGYVTPPETFHAYQAIPGKNWEIAWAHIAAASIPTQLARPVRLTVATEPFAVSISGLYNESFQTASRDPLVSESWIALIRAYGLRICAQASAIERGIVVGDNRLVRLFADVASDLAYPWTIAEMAKRLKVSTEHLRRLCHQDGLGAPMRRVTDLRLRHAAALLSTGFYTVERAAHRVGFQNPYAFSTAFKRVFGQPPTVFKQKSTSVIRRNGA